MGGTPTFVYRDGARLTPYMFWQLERLNADVKRIFGVEIRVSSGIRLPQEQIDIFLERYVTAANVRGRRVYDTRMWRGIRWFRISSAGTVAVPSTSNHEIQGTTAAVDLRDTGSDAGITSKNSTRGRWIRQNAWRYDLVASGDGFAEGWHFDIRNIFNTPPGGIDMPLSGDDKQFIKDSMFEFYDGAGLKGAEGWKFVREGIFNQPIQAQDDAGAALYFTDATRKGTTTTKTAYPVMFTVAGFLASTAAQVSAIRSEGITLNATAIDELAAGISEGLAGKVGGATPAQVQDIVYAALGRLTMTAAVQPGA